MSEVKLTYEKTGGETKDFQIAITAESDTIPCLMEAWSQLLYLLTGERYDCVIAEDSDASDEDDSEYEDDEDGEDDYTIEWESYDDEEEEDDDITETL